MVVDLRDAEVARLEILNEALDPLFREIPDNVDLFDRGVSQGATPRLWIDVVAHVVMGRDKRIYRFVQDTRYGRKVLAESHDVAVIVKAVTDYIARRMVEREQALGDDDRAGAGRKGEAAPPGRLLAVRTRRGRRCGGAVRAGAVCGLAQSVRLRITVSRVLADLMTRRLPSTPREICSQGHALPSRSIL